MLSTIGYKKHNFNIMNKTELIKVLAEKTGKSLRNFYEHYIEWGF